MSWTTIIEGPNGDVFGFDTEDVDKFSTPREQWVKQGVLIPGVDERKLGAAYLVLKFKDGRGPVWKSKEEVESYG